MRRRTVLAGAGAGLGAAALAGWGSSGDGAGPSGADPTYRTVARWSLADYGRGWEEVWPYARTLHDVTVVGDRAYCALWEAGAWILDVSDPTDPTAVGRAGEYSLSELRDLTDDVGGRQRAYLEGRGNAHYVDADHDRSLLAVGAEGWDDPYTDARGPGGIDLYDLSDPTDPDRLAAIAAPYAENETRMGTWTTAHNFEVRGDRLYASWYQGGVTVHDVSDPAAPELLSWWRRPEVARFWTARVGVPGECFIASSYPRDGTRGAVYVFPDRAGRQSDPPRLVGPDSGRSNPRPPATGEAFTPLGSVDVPGAAEAVVGEDGRTVFVATGDGFAVVDVSDPTTPRVVAERRSRLADRPRGPLESVLDVAVDGDRLLVAGPARSGAPRGTVLFDVSDPASPGRVGGFLRVNSTVHNADLADGFAYLTANRLPGRPVVVADFRAGFPEAALDGGTTGTGTTGGSGPPGSGDADGNGSATRGAGTGDGGGQSTPGFGGLAALGGLGLGAGAYRYLRRALAASSGTDGGE